MAQVDKALFAAINGPHLGTGAPLHYRVRHWQQGCGSHEPAWYQDQHSWGVAPTYFEHSNGGA